MGGHKVNKIIKSIENFYKVNPKTNCWEWQFGLTSGYGLFWDGENNRQIKAHRYTYEKYKGKIPEGLQIDHLCKNTKCCNPDHLEAVTQTVNMRRCSQTKLTEFMAAKIREKGPFQTQASLALEFGVSHRTIGHILEEKTWKGIF